MIFNYTYIGEENVVRETVLYEGDANLTGETVLASMSYKIIIKYYSIFNNVLKIIRHKQHWEFWSHCFKFYSGNWNTINKRNMWKSGKRRNSYYKFT